MSTGTTYMQQGLLHQMFFRQAKATPEHVAVVEESGKEIKFRNLDENSEALGKHLVYNGVTPNACVGIYLDKSIEYTTAYIAILRAGAAYLPLDVAYPQSMLKSVLEDAKPKAVITVKDLAHNLAGYDNIIVLEEEWEKNIVTGEATLPTELTLDNLAYIVYSSGTTGKPKVKQIENDIVKDEEFVQSLMENGRLFQVILYLKDIIDTKNIAADMPYIGKVGVDYCPNLVSITKNKENQAQIMATKTIIKSIKNIALKVQKKITACGNGVTGCTQLSHGSIAFANEKERNITVVKSDGSLDFKIDLKPYRPLDITYIPNTNTIVVTSRSSNDIKIVDVNARGVLKTYCLGAPCAGIAYTEKRIILCSTNKGILELNQHDGSVKTIVLDKLHDYAHVALLGDQIFYTNSLTKSVICCDLLGRKQWAFQYSKLSRLFVVTVDTDGHLFVAGNRSHNVVVISPDGKQHKQLLSSKDGVDWPNGLIYDRHKNQLLVTNYDKGAVLYTVT
ncbi:unnamed protein product [Mytilus coruscus]|uniref:AMP-dependent synthetase/ligase domain-containing protein n=1 Tax=Mytilus coruscus TaxID=42192 RepID=A0A6J8ETD6_MYTCO|nr:unnamed protein product [Mytilus coruscus]